MSEEEIREKLLATTKVFVPNIKDCYRLVDRLLDLVEDVAEGDRDAAYDAGYTAGLDDGAEEVMDCASSSDEEIKQAWEEGFDAGAQVALDPLDEGPFECNNE